MDFFDNLVLPQSTEHIELLHFMLLLVLFLFMPFISLVFGGTWFSIHYKKKLEKGGNKNFEILAKEFITVTTVNKSIGVILGIMPLITLILIYAQLLNKSSSSSLGYLFVSLILILPALVLIYTYRYSLSFTQIFNSVTQTTDADTREEFLHLKSTAKKLSSKAGRNGLIFLFFSIWFLICGLTEASNFGISDNSFLGNLFSYSVIIRLLFFIFFAAAISGAAVLFSIFYWEGGNKKYSVEFKEFVRNHSIRVYFISALVLPVLLLLIITSIPTQFLSGSIFGFSVLGLVLLFISYHSFYSLRKSISITAGGVVFYSLLFALLTFVLKDQLVMSNATKTHSVILGAEYDKYFAGLRGESGVVSVSGEEIFKSRCSACHSFDVKLVGPPYKESMPKYEGKLAQLVAFIKNPVKVNPAFPPMPNPGLKPNEVEAVAKYILEAYKK